MTTSSAEITPGTGLDVATHTISEGGETRHIQGTAPSTSAGADMTLGGTYTEVTNTLTNTYVTVAANASRRALILCNNSDTIMTARIGGTATAAIGIPIPANTHLAMFGDQCPSALVTLFCAGASKAYTIYER